MARIIRTRGLILARRWGGGLFRRVESDVRGAALTPGPSASVSVARSAVSRSVPWSRGGVAGGKETR